MLTNNPLKTAKDYTQNVKSRDYDSIFPYTGCITFVRDLQEKIINQMFFNDPHIFEFLLPLNCGTKLT